MPVQLPTRFVDDRISVLPVTTDGHQLELSTDSAGGMVFSAAAVERLGLVTSTLEEDGETYEATNLPAFSADAWIPGGRDDADPCVAIVMDGSTTGLFEDGLLGQSWFGGRRWTIDYASQLMLLWSADEQLPIDPHHTLRLGFQSRPNGDRANSFATIEAEVDGEVLPFLFDTGATMQAADGPRATSFIVASVFDRWRADHGDWLVIEKADSGAEHIIEVPRVSVAGHVVGPVWFTRRADTNFHDWMSQWLDRRVDGALGGSLFRYFAISIDYPDATLCLRAT